jgi:hypothetical protein
VEQAVEQGVDQAMEQAMEQISLLDQSLGLELDVLSLVPWSQL